MCGIYSVLNWTYSQDDKLSEKLKQQFMNGRIRGPDHTVFSVYDHQVALGFHRLAINGLDEVSNQPIRSSDGKLMVICNGQIYNWRELEKKYGFHYKTNSDCESIIHVYERFGIEHTLQLLDGVFAFMIFDYRGKEPKCHVARDPFGVRPLYRFGGYTIHNPNESFSGFSSLLKMVSSNNISYNDVIRITNVKQFEPGTYETYTYINTWKKTKQDRYFVPNKNIFHFSNTYEKTVIDYSKCIVRDYLMKAVEKRVNNTDRSIACLLSGGLDSSLICALVAKYYDKPLETYSIGMEGSPDLEYAKKVADYIGSKHTEIHITDEMCRIEVENVIYNIESYDTTTVRASMGNYLVAKYISEHSEAKVIFNGDGSDELCGGYIYMHMAPDATTFDMECRRLLKDIHAFDVLRSDRSISSHGLEARTPFLDKTFVNMYMSIPEEIRFKGMKNSGQLEDGCVEKWLLRSAFSDMKLLPDEVLWRKKEAFSDGIIKLNHTPWYKQLGDRYLLSGDIQLQTYLLNSIGGNKTPDTIEKQVYQFLFLKCFGGGIRSKCEDACKKMLLDLVPYFWMPKFIENAKDSSARTLSIYQETIHKT